jgi:hypothetical protein
MWKNFTRARYSSSEQVQDVPAHADQLVLLMEILKNRDPAIIQIEAIRRIISISTANQFRLRDIQKTNVTDMADAIDKKHPVISVMQKLLSGVFLMKFSNALMLLALRQDRPARTSQGQVAKEHPEEPNQECKHK